MVYIRTYPIHIFGTNVSSMNKEMFHNLQVTIFCCHMQRSPLIETKKENITNKNKRRKITQKNYRQASTFNRLVCVKALIV